MVLSFLLAVKRLHGSDAIVYFSVYEPKYLKGVINLKRYGQVIKVKPDKLDYYKYLHSNPWPEICEMISRCNISNYSIYERDGYLFAYFEYLGNDFEADMAIMAADPITQKWWAECKPCQEPLRSSQQGEWWANMEEVFHVD